MPKRRGMRCKHCGYQHIASSGNSKSLWFFYCPNCGTYGAYGKSRSEAEDFWREEHGWDTDEAD